MPLALVVNRLARGVRRRHLGPKPFWRGVVREDLVHLTQSLEELDQVVAALQQAGAPAIAVLGGDGSIHHLVDSVVRHYGEAETPLVLALAGGTMNGLPRALGTGGAPARVLHEVATSLRQGTPRVWKRHVLRVRDMAEGRDRHGFGFATGLIYRVYEYYYRTSDPGMVDAVRASLLPLTAALFGGPLYRGIHLEVQTDARPWLPEPHTLLASVMDKPLLWFQPFGAPLGDAAAFHLAATSMRPWEIAPRLWALFRGRCRHPRLRVGTVGEATVRGNVGYLIDGDLYPGDGTVDVALSVGPRLRFLAPPEAPVHP